MVDPTINLFSETHYFVRGGNTGFGKNSARFDEYNAIFDEYNARSDEDGLGLDEDDVGSKSRKKMFVVWWSHHCVPVDLEMGMAGGGWCWCEGFFGGVKDVSELELGNVVVMISPWRLFFG